jgi:hypothetical protein
MRNGEKPLEVFLIMRGLYQKCFLRAQAGMPWQRCVCFACRCLDVGGVAT